MFQGGVLGGFYSPSIVLTIIPASFEMFNFTSFSFVNLVFLSLLLATIVVFIVHLVSIIRGKHHSSLPFLVSWLLLGTISAMASVAIFKDGFYPDVNTGTGVIHDSGAFAYFVGLFFAQRISAGQLAFAFLPILLVFFSLVFAVIAEIQDLVYLVQHPLLPKREYAHDAVLQDKVVVVREDKVPNSPSSEEIRKLLRDEVGFSSSPAFESDNAQDAERDGMPQDDGKVSPTGKSKAPQPSVLTGPFLVQYINAISPDGTVIKTEKVFSSTGLVSSETSGIESSFKPLTKDDIRQIIKDEIKAALEPEIKSGPKSPIIVEPAPEASLSSEEIRRIIAKELNVAHDKQKAEAELYGTAGAAKSQENVRDVIKEELAAYKKSEEALLLVKQEEESRRIEEAKKAALNSDQIRQIVSEELAKHINKEIEKPVSAVLTEKKIETPQKAVTEKAESIKAEPKPVIVEEPKEAPKVMAEKRPAVHPQVKRVVGAVNPNLPPHEKIIRIPFPTRMISASSEIQQNYNELKSEIMSYGVKSRVSNSGDTFRLHKVTFMKLIIAGKGLKLYLALDPKDYSNSTIPFLDAGHKGIYKEIPFVFKVKSSLSLRRAKQLIAEAVAKGGLEQKTVDAHDWAQELKDFKEQGSDDED